MLMLLTQEMHCQTAGLGDKLHRDMQLKVEKYLYFLK